ncbi:NAD(P)-binding protein [Coniochaeta ligniaria NRRL 30616]|uniref:NAD(P)-binding protein n=1 Tax=Coniochaeta ligniaria NRRL 30616 TaxID=1408157 RepID=A0A1J7IL91_9PEZI|nr:NAD(P)-binding protein [Coniochaeta ligniaria NRRL 30616]
MAAIPVVLILGAGPRVGAAVAKKFSSIGYKVAIASRTGTGTKNDSGVLSLQADFSKPETVPPLFEAVKAEFQTAPSVVVYNAAALTPPSDPTSLFSIPAESFAADLNINTTSAYVAAQLAVSGWETLPADAKKTFIYTGNALNVQLIPAPAMLTLGVGKSASSFWVGLADALYSAKGSRFFYADERFGDGKTKGMAIDGAAHADFYEQLAKHEGDVPWHATFVKDKGYAKF